MRDRRQNEVRENKETEIGRGPARLPLLLAASFSLYSTPPNELCGRVWWVKLEYIPDPVLLLVAEMISPPDRFGFSAIT